MYQAAIYYFYLFLFLRTHQDRERQQLVLVLTAAAGELCEPGAYGQQELSLLGGVPRAEVRAEGVVLMYGCA